MAKLISLGNNNGNENRPSDEELNQMFGVFMDAFFGGLSDEDIDEESDDDEIIPFDEFDDSDYWDDLYVEGLLFHKNALPLCGNPTDRQ